MSSKHPTPSSCERSTCELEVPGLALAASARIPFDPAASRWEGVAEENYKPGDGQSWCGITRMTLLGPKQPGMDFHVRYFEISAGGQSSRERHEHEHVVIGWRGEGVVEFDGRDAPVRKGDIVYIAPGSVHQFRCERGAPEPFGFLCLVNADRDRPLLCPPEGTEAATS